MRQLIIDDFNGLQAFINLAEKAAKERNDVHFRVVNTDTDNTQKQIESKQNTIRLLRRENRQLKSLLKTKDRLLHAQKTFYEEMNRYSDSRMKEDVKNIESTITECLERVLINGAYTV